MSVTLQETEIVDYPNDGKRTSKSSTDLTSEICRQFPELEEEIKFATVPRRSKSSSDDHPRSPQSLEDEGAPEFEKQAVQIVVNGCEVVDKSEESHEKSVFEHDGSTASERTVQPHRLNRRRTGSLKSIRKRLSIARDVQRRSTIGIGDNRGSPEDVDDTTNDAAVMQDATDAPAEKDKDKGTAAGNKAGRKRPFFGRRRKDKLDRKFSEPIGPSDQTWDSKPVKRNSADRLISLSAGRSFVCFTASVLY